MLAETFSIQMVNPILLWDSLDCSTDLAEDQEFISGFERLLMNKYESCTDWFRDNLLTLGQQEPVVVIIRTDGRWQFDEGHHRLADAMAEHRDLAVIFDDTNADDDSVMCYQVARPDMEAYHDQIADFIPAPRITADYN